MANEIETLNSCQVKPSSRLNATNLKRTKDQKNRWTAMETQQWITEQNSNSTHNCTHDCVENPIESDKLVEWCVERVNSNSNDNIGPKPFGAEGLIFYFHSSTSWLPIIFFYIAKESKHVQIYTHEDTRTHTVLSIRSYGNSTAIFLSMGSVSNPMF